MSYYKSMRHETNLRRNFSSGNSALTYGAVVGKLAAQSERPIQGRNGDHLQFYLDVQDGSFYQVDVNTLSRDGSDIEVYIAEEPLPAPEDATADNPFGAAAFGPSGNASLSYQAIGLSNNDFVALSYVRIESQLEADLGTSMFVTAYGMMFDDGGPDGKGIHDIHYNPTRGGASDQDGALALYSQDAGTKALKRTWYFFKFNDQSIG